jgi:hypothetical protein
VCVNNPDRSPVGINRLTENCAGSRLLFLAELLESGIGAPSALHYRNIANGFRLLEAK